MSMRIGQGFDVHPYVAGRPLILGGVTVPHHKGLAGHSDADVLLHALCDALLGAVGLGDIGQHFPPGDPRYANIDSRILLREVWQQVQIGGWNLANIDLTLIMELPKISPHYDQIRNNIAVDLGCEPTLINVKATTTEKLGFIGREQGIAAQAIVLLTR